MSAPRVVAVGGGHGLAATLRAVRGFTDELCAVVSVADDGGSTGRLRDAAPRPAPGDLRKCLIALAGDDSLFTRALSYRFDSGELSGHALGNLLITALCELDGDLVAALDEIVRLIGAAGRVLPSTVEPVELVGCTAGGREVVGQVAVMECSDVTRVRLSPPSPQAPGEAIEAIRSADMIVLGPGSLYTSVLAATAVPAIGEALAEGAQRLVYVCNLRPQVPETEGFTVADHVAALARHGLEPATVLYDPATIGGAEGVDNAVGRPLADDRGAAHDAALLGRALHELSGTE